MQEALGRARDDVMIHKDRYPTSEVGAYQNQPMDDGGRWIENPAAAGLRFLGWQDELRRCDHQGWFLDSEFQDETARGCVYQLPARNGRAQYIPAARRADHYAERLAEREREGPTPYRTCPPSRKDSPKARRILAPCNPPCVVQY